MKSGNELKPNSLALLICCLALPCATAHAQSSVTLYGLVDTAVRYTTHADKAGNDRTQLSNGGLSESHWGLLGVEDLGGGNSVVFQLENRFFPNSGATDPSYPFFNTAFVGIKSSTLGRLTLGRQLNPVADAVLRSYVTNPWLPTVYEFRPEAGMAQGSWTSNMAKYAARWQDVTLELSYAFGGVAGAFGAGSQIGASLSYLPSNLPLRLAAGYLDMRDAENTSAHFKTWTAGAAYTFSTNTTVSAGWAVNRQDYNYAGNSPNGPFTPAKLTALGFTQFSSRKMFYGGVTQLLGNWTHLSANVWRTLQDGKTASANGNATQFQVVADYGLSSRTSVYLEADYSLYRGGLIGAQLQGFNGLSAAAGATQLGVMAGLHHRF
ncbi:porin [Burkholderia cenocepacia]|uniref:porin n=1 Tax=Burkholderia cenocepacia TaxID=95486 RepID=UPI000F5ADE30|nr:porin [Burkholderia cenocepacia]MBN3503151.1 porin [Burkholderia cenocepacia]MCO1394342.1 porin [Burkholderia cenocepacia]MCO1404842.1 porin [Burkholderia cenocepacia]RQT97012.1 porin [Burkholderia cenocepacia]RQU28677.1 porin [Burkholderia cenocepacia]